MNDLQELASVGLALSDVTRLRLLHALAGGELCVCQLVELAGLATSTVSKHCSVLERAGLVARRKDGRWVYYRLARATTLSRVVLAELRAREELDADGPALRRIRALPAEILCKQQRKK